MTVEELPVDQQAPSPTGADPALPARLVIVDDAEEVRSLLRTVLGRDERLDLVGEADDGLQALRLAQELHPDVMLLDVSMPRLDGIAAADRIRSVSPGTCVIMYTAHDDTGLAEQAARAGARAVISKSSPVHELADTLLARWREVPPQPAGDSEADRLHRSEERFRLLVEAVEDYAIFMLDRAGVIASWNSGAQRITGYVASEIIGRHFRVFYPEDKQNSAYPEYELVQALAHGHFEEEGWRVRKDGSLMWTSVLITAVYDSSGEHIGFAKVTRDMSERRRVQEERERYAQQLQQLNSELAKANDVLAETARQRTDFLAVTAHELRTPVSVITGSADALDKLWDHLDEPERRDLLRTIATSAGRLNRLLNDLLTAARIESGGVELNRAPVRLADLLANAITAARVTQGDLGPELDVFDDLMVLADRDRLAQAVDNLVSNAYRHGRPPVRVTLRRNGDCAEIMVLDAGQGLRPDEADRVFERYVTAGGKRTTGLGLYIVRELARAHDGDAWWRADGEPGFVISLPILDPDHAHVG